MIEMGLICPVWQFRDREQGRIAEFDLSVLAGDTRHPYRLQCEQFKLVGWLYERLSGHDGAALLFEHEVTGVAQDGDGVTVTCRTPDGETEHRGAWLIAADGGAAPSASCSISGSRATPIPSISWSPARGSTSSRRCRTSARSTTPPIRWSGSCCWRFPTCGGSWFPVEPAVEADDAVSDRYLQGCLNNLLPRDEPYEIEVRAIYRVSQRVADTYRKGRVFLAGDAAHINNPLGGMGLNGGLHDAIDLTGRLASVTHGRAAEAELDGYEARRKPEAVNAINAITERNKKLMEERDPEVRARNLDDWRALARRSGAVLPLPARHLDDLIAAALGHDRMSGETAMDDWPDAVFGVLNDAGVRQVCYVPDNGHRRLIERCHADNAMLTTRLTGEEEGVAALTGAWLGGDKGVLLMQSSGVGKCINMMGIVQECRVPLLMLVTMRGQWGEFNPWQVPMGRAAAPALEAAGVIVHEVDDAARVAETVHAAARLAFDAYRPVAVLIGQRVVGFKDWTK